MTLMLTQTQTMMAGCCVCHEEGRLAEVQRGEEGWMRINVRADPKADATCLYTCSDACRARFWSSCVLPDGRVYDGEVYEPLSEEVAP